MDVIVTAAAPNIWNLTDLLGRNMGTITGTPTGFQVYPASLGIEALDAVTSRPHPSLDEDLAEIERVTRGLAGAQVEARGAIDSARVIMPECGARVELKSSSAVPFSSAWGLSCGGRYVSPSVESDLARAVKREGNHPRGGACKVHQIRGGGSGGHCGRDLTGSCRLSQVAMARRAKTNPSRASCAVAKARQDGLLKEGTLVPTEIWLKAIADGELDLRNGSSFHEDGADAQRFRSGVHDVPIPT